MSTKSLGLLGAGVVLVIGTLVIAGQANQSASQPPTTPTSVIPTTQSSAAPESSATASLDPRLNDPTFTTLDGQKIALADDTGDKPVVLYFWASWCHNCQRHMPTLNEQYSRYQNQLEIIGVNLQESTRTVESYVDRRSIDFPIALDPTGALARQFGIYYTQTHVFISRTGQLVGAVPGDIIEQDLQSLLEAS